MKTHQVQVMREIGGIALFLLGLAVIFNNLSGSNAVWSLFWPLLLFVPSVYLLFHYFMHPKPTAFSLSLGLVLLSASLVYFIDNITGGIIRPYVRPALFGLITISFFVAYRVHRRFWSLILACVTLCVEAVLIVQLLGFSQYIWPSALIIIGIWMIGRRPKA